jgi:transcriptional regulator with XRE-family HTH domain
MRFNFIRAKELVEASDLKRSAVAKHCRLTDDTLTQYLNGHGSGPSKLRAELMAEILEVPLSEIWDERAETQKKAS